MKRWPATFFGRLRFAPALLLTLALPAMGQQAGMSLLRSSFAPAPETPGSAALRPGLHYAAAARLRAPRTGRAAAAARLRAPRAGQADAAARLPRLGRVAAAARLRAPRTGRAAAAARLRAPRTGRTAAAARLRAPRTGQADATASPVASGGLDAQAILHPAPDSWPSYNSDYSGQRFRNFTQINRGNVRQLTLAWAFQTGGVQPAGLKATPLLVNGVLYFSEPDNVWAVDARTGRQLWHYQYPANPGLHIGQRGVAMWRSRIYMETPDAHLICLDARNGTLLWNVVMADTKLGYWATTAPLVVRDHVLVGISGDDNDLRGFVAAYDPVSGAQQWRWWSTPRAGTPAAATWPNDDARRHGGGMTWITGTYDPKLNLVYWGTANATPVMDGRYRKGGNLYTCSIVALNPETGRLAWAFQATPHDVHDYDAVQTPVLVDGTWQGKPRKLLIQANRNGYFFVLDRATGKNLLTRAYSTVTWSKGVSASGQPIPDPDHMPTRAGTLVQPDADGATNWWSPSFDPQTGLLYVNMQRAASIYYVTAEGKPAGFAGTDADVWKHSWLDALDYQTGRAKWEYDLGDGESGASTLTTAGGLVFSADTSGNMIALDAGSGKLLWHSYGGNGVDNAPITYMLDGVQYVLYGAQDVMFAFRLPGAE